MLVSGIELFIAIALGIMSIAGVFYLIKRQDRQLDDWWKHENDRDYDDDNDNGSLRT